MAMKGLGLGLFLGAALVVAGPVLADAKDAKTARGVSLFMGNYGYTLEYPAGFTALPSFDDPEKTMERVLFYPQGTPAGRMQEEHYAENGIVRVEVAPIEVRTPQGRFRAGLKELKAVIPETIRRNGEKCTVGKFASPFPAAKFTITGRTPLVQVILEGAKVTYIFTSAKDDAPLRRLIKSLKEIAPSDKPGL